MLNLRCMKEKQRLAALKVRVLFAASSNRNNLLRSLPRRCKHLEFVNDLCYVWVGLCAANGRNNDAHEGT